MNHDCQPVVRARLGEETRAGAAGRRRGTSLPLLSLFQLAAERDPMVKGAQAGLRAVETDGTAIGLELAVPIFSGGGVVSRTREAAERHQQAIEQREQARRESYRRTRVAFLDVMAGIGRIKALKQAAQSCEVSVSSTQAGLEMGTRTAVDVVVTERALFGARRDYARARYNYLLDTLRLKFCRRYPHER